MQQEKSTEQNRQAIWELGKKWGTPTLFATLKEGFRRQFGYDPYGLYDGMISEAGKNLFHQDTLPTFMRTFVRTQA